MLVSRAAILHQSQELFRVIWVGNGVDAGEYPINLNVQGGSRNMCQLSFVFVARVRRSKTWAHFQSLLRHCTDASAA